jgi:sensor histidine kinase YesM
MILSSIITYIIIRKNILNSFIPLAIQSAEQQKNNLDLFLDLATESSKLLVSDPEVIRILLKNHITSGEFLKTIDKLNDIQSSNLNITGLTLYGMNGVFYPSNPSNNTANSSPDLSQILRDPVIRNFIHQPEKSLWYERFQKDYWITNLTLNLHLYSGVFTFVQKVYAPGGSLIGLLMTDIAIDSLYDQFHRDKFNAETYLYSNRRGILNSPYTIPITPSEIKQVHSRLNMKVNHFLMNDNQKIVIFHPINHSSDFIIRVIPLTNILKEINKLLLFLVFINVILIFGVIFLGFSISKSISLPLGELYTKMQKFTKIE